MGDGDNAWAFGPKPFKWTEEQTDRLNEVFYRSDSLVYARTLDGSTVRLDAWPRTLGWVNPGSIETLSCTPAMLAMTRSK